MPRGKPKRGEFDFTIWFEDGSRIQWKSNRPQNDDGIAAAIKRYLLPVVQRIEARSMAGAVDPHLESEGTPTTRAKDDLTPLANVNEMGTWNIK